VTRALALASIPLVLMWSRAAEADDPSDVEALLAQPVVATASHTAEDASTAPATTTTITAEDLRRYGIHSLDEAINFLSLGMITQNPLHSVDIGARGVLLTSDFGNHMLLLVNGHSMNEQWDGTAYFDRGAAIPFELIDHIEIILGPGSVLYGSNAMLGVINIITKRASQYEGLHFIAESDIPTSLRGAVGYGKEFKLFGKQGEVTAQAEYYDQSGPSFYFPYQAYGLDSVTGLPKNFGPNTPPGLWGGTVHNEYYTQIPAAYVRAIWGDFEVNARAATYKRATPYLNEFNLYSGNFDDPNAYELDRWISLDIKHRAALSSIATLKSRLYGDLYDYKQNALSNAAEDCQPGQSNGCLYDDLGNSRWMGLEEQLAVDWRHDASVTTLFGVDGRLRSVGEENDYYDRITGVEAPPVGAFQHFEQAIGIYGQQTWRPLSRLSFNAGIRFDADERLGSPKLSPRAVVAVNPWGGATLKAIYSQAFRAPTPYESDYFDGQSVIPNPNLSPESVQSVEGSFEQRIGTLRTFFDVFATHMSDMIEQETLGANDPALARAIQQGFLPAGSTSAEQYQNVSVINSYGFDVAVDGSALHRDLRFGANFTGAQALRNEPVAGSSQVVQIPLPVAPNFFGNARISYDLPGNLPVIALASVIVARRLADQALAGGFTPTAYAPPQVELRATLSGIVPWVTGLSYRFFADYSVAGTNPYIAGPVQAATAAMPSATLSPVDQFRTTLGLQYDFR
jgi:outer membrane receptor for ferrienterochelin and colicins